MRGPCSPANCSSPAGAWAGLWLVASYSGGGWTSDWFEHWERTQFFLDRWPLDTKFLGFGALPARPPLANLVTGALLAVTRQDFAHYQFFTTLLNSLAFLPAALLARRFDQRLGGGRGRRPRRHGRAGRAADAQPLVRGERHVRVDEAHHRRLHPRAGCIFSCARATIDAPGGGGPAVRGGLAARPPRPLLRRSLRRPARRGLAGFESRTLAGTPPSGGKRGNWP